MTNVFYIPVSTTWGLNVNLISRAFPSSQHLDQRVLYTPLCCRHWHSNPKTMPGIVHTKSVQTESHLINKELFVEKLTVLQTKGVILLTMR